MCAGLYGHPVYIYNISIATTYCLQEAVNWLGTISAPMMFWTLAVRGCIFYKIPYNIGVTQTMATLHMTIGETRFLTAAMSDRKKLVSTSKNTKHQIGVVGMNRGAITTAHLAGNDSVLSQSLKQLSIGRPWLNCWNLNASMFHIFPMGYIWECTEMRTALDGIQWRHEEQRGTRASAESWKIWFSTKFFFYFFTIYAYSVYCKEWHILLPKIQLHRKSCKKVVYTQVVERAQKIQTSTVASKILLD